MKRLREEEDDAAEVYDAWCQKEERRTIMGVAPRLVTDTQRGVIGALCREMTRLVAERPESLVDYDAYAALIEQTFAEMRDTRAQELLETHQSALSRHDNLRRHPGDTLRQHLERRHRRELQAIDHLYRMVTDAVHRERTLIARSQFIAYVARLPPPPPRTTTRDTPPVYTPQSACVVPANSGLFWMWARRALLGGTDTLATIQAFGRVARVNHTLFALVATDISLWALLVRRTAIYRQMPLSARELAIASLPSLQHLVRLDTLALLSRQQLLAFAAHHALPSPYRACHQQRRGAPIRRVCDSHCCHTLVAPLDADAGGCTRRDTALRHAYAQRQNDALALAQLLLVFLHAHGFVISPLALRP